MGAFALQNAVCFQACQKYKVLGSAQDILS